MMLSRVTLSRRRLLAASAALPLLAACNAASFGSSTDYLGEASAVFTGGNLALTALTVLVRSGVIAKTKAQSWNSYVTAMTGQFAALHTDIDTSQPLSQAIIDQAAALLNSFQAVAAPTAGGVTQPQATAAMAARPQRKKFVPVVAVIAWVLANLGTLSSAGSAIYSIIHQLIGEVAPTNPNTTTVAQADSAYQGYSLALADWNSAIA